jgi:hypothetical protein
MKPISKNIIEKSKTIRKELDVVEKDIIDRIDYIVKTIIKTYKKKLQYWHFSNAAEDEIGDISENIYHAESHGDVSITIEPYEDLDFIDKENCEWGLEDGFPYEWLFTDFEEELKEGRKAYLEKEKQNKSKEKSENSKKVLETIKSKLSKEELKALGLK